MFLAVATALTHGCRAPQENLPENAIINSPDATPLPNIYIDGQGHSVKLDGWLPPNIQKGRTSGWREFKLPTEDGREVVVKYTDFTLPRPLIIDTPYNSERLNAEAAPAKATWGTAATVGRSKPFCYTFLLHKAIPIVSSDNSGHDHGIMVRYCDKDGDRIFETSPSKDFQVPAWVK